MKVAKFALYKQSTLPLRVVASLARPVLLSLLLRPVSGLPNVGSDAGSYLLLSDAGRRAT